jgi:hypothetical protein
MSRIVLYILLLALIKHANITQAQVVFNEICTFNDDVLEDIDGDKSDWIELYNTTNIVQNLSNLSIRSEKQKLNFNLPEINLNANSFAIIYVSGKNKISPQIHCNFKMIVSDTLYLIQNNQIINSIVVPNLKRK